MLTGSFHTIVNQGLSGVISSADHGRSTSAGATLTRPHLLIRSLPPVTNTVNSGTTALLTDHYELTMLQAALRSGTASRRAVFEVFARQLPHGRRYGVVAGTGRLLDAVERFRFGPQELAFLRDNGIVDETTLRYLSSYRFGGNIWGYAEGDVYFPGSPIIVVEGTFAEAVLLETLVLSILNHDSAIASPASRFVTAAGRGGARADRDGLPAPPRARRGGGRAGRVHRRVRLDVELAGPALLRRPVERDLGARLHPRARQRAARVRVAARLPGAVHDTARGHLRRRAGGAHRGGRGGHIARRGTDRQRRPGRAGGVRAFAARLAG